MDLSCRPGDCLAFIDGLSGELWQPVLMSPTKNKLVVDSVALIVAVKFLCHSPSKTLRDGGAQKRAGEKPALEWESVTRDESAYEKD